MQARMQARPLLWLTVIALVPRVVAALFSGGYFAQDDHFLVIEAAQSWVDGHDYNNWLPWNQGAHPAPTGHTWLYPGLHFLLFKLCTWAGMDDPSAKMVLVRLLHALWSLVAVRTGYRMARKLAGSATAWHTGLFLALFCWMPFLSVRNLVEMASMPAVMLCAWQLMKDGPVPRMRSVVLAGLWAGLAMDIRFQTVFFAGGAGLALLLLKEWRKALVFGGALLVPVVVVQAGVDLFIWGRPFAEMTEYVRYNLANSTTYFDQPWYNYLLVLAGIFIPPFSLAVLFGFFKRPKPLVAWLPVFAFLFFHSLFPNKQERFILTIVPLVFVLGHVEWERWRTGNAWWQRHVGLWRGVLAWTWGINLVVLVGLCFSYSKRERVEAMGLLRGSGVGSLVIEDSVEGDPPMMPLYYLGRWDVSQIMVTDTAMDVVAAWAGVPTERRPGAVLFIGTEQLPRRLARMELALGPLRYIGTAQPGLLDRTLHWLNPVNRNETITAYAIGGGPVISRAH